MNRLKKYSLTDVLNLTQFKLRTLVTYKQARLIRFPFRLRGKNQIKIGEGFTCGFNCRLDALNFNKLDGFLIEIGNNVEINDSVHIGAVEKVIIEDGVLIASRVYITDHNHGSYKGSQQDNPLVAPKDRKIFSSPVKICKNVWLGEMVCVLQGVTIGEGSIIGAMSVVTKDIPPYSIAIGSPARVIKTFNFEINSWESTNL